MELRGTIRTFEQSVKDDVLRRMDGIIKGIESSFEVTCKLDYQHGYPALLNNNSQLDHVLHSLEDAAYVKITEENPPSMGGEDFAYYLEKVPGCYFYTGVRNPEKESIILITIHCSTSMRMA
ncbi:M20/M25/M40 family metallo-hydrolase [Salinicoccus sp. CNSTN-B1]